jgi:hypothetical protein
MAELARIENRGWNFEEEEMTTVQITLPDRLAQEAESAGLLSPGLLEKWLREQLKAHRASELESAMRRMDLVDSPQVLSPEAVAEEIAAMRAERRSSRNR